MTMETTAALPTILNGEYELQEIIARGGMATVYKGHSRSLNGPVAIKVLAPRLASNQDLMARFQEEAQGIHKLHHPNILEVYYQGVDNGLAYIAMRYVPGGTLKDLVEAVGGPMDLRTAARLTAQVASALQHAHENGMFHLDVKPGNVLLGDAEWPLLADFGIMRIAGETREDGHRIAGTPAYMSPEQWQGGPIDGRSDEYSLGLMFYELVTGRRAFKGETSAELREQHLVAEPVRPRQINPGIPGPVEEVMLRAIAKQPDDRFPKIDEFGTALVEAVERSRGMQVETKQAIVGVVPNLLALVLLSLIAPILESLPNPSLPIFRELTLDWPIAAVVAILQVALLLSIRWQIIGLGTRVVGVAVDSLDRFTRLYVHLGTDSGGLLQIAKWRNAAMSTGEGLINFAYLFVIYQLAATPLIKTLALPLDPGLTDLIATGVTAIVLLVSAVIVLRIYQATGPIIGVCSLAVCWAFVSALPLIDLRVLGTVSLQWLVKLLVGLAVLAAFLMVRTRLQRAVREAVVPLALRQIRSLQRGQLAEQIAARRQQIELTLDQLVDVCYLVIGYAIIALPLQRVASSLADSLVSAIAITVGAIAVAVVLINRMRVTGGIVAATLGLVIFSPTLFGLPLFLPTSSGSASSQWIARVVIGLAILGLFLSVRQRIQLACRPAIVPILARQLASMRPAASESEESERRQSLGQSSDALVDFGYLLVGYFAVVAPAAGALAYASDLSALRTLIYVAFVATLAYVVYQLIRNFVPNVGRAPRLSIGA
jgi:tRNA A-37 threonylcarbamoyl transferase component Bud32